MRLFLAVDLPVNVQDQISDLACPELDHVRWSNSEQLHLTLLFIGDQPQHRLDEIIEAVAEIDFTPFSLTFKNIGYFKSGIIWLGVEHSEPLVRLQRSLSHRIRQLNIPFEQRKFTPHITLGRCKQLTPDILAKVSAKASGFERAFYVEAFQLKSSILKTEGAVYTTEADFWPNEPN